MSQQQIINLEWGNGQSERLAFRNTDTIFNVKTRILTSTNVPIDKQCLIGINTTDNSLPLYCLNLDNPQTVLLIPDYSSNNSNDNVSIGENTNQKTKENEQEQTNKKETEKQKEQEDQQEEQEKEKEKENTNENEEQTNKNEKEKNNENENENENEKEKSQGLSKSDSQFAKELQEQIWREEGLSQTKRRTTTTSSNIFLDNNTRNSPNIQNLPRKWSQDSRGNWHRNMNPNRPSDVLSIEKIAPLLPPNLTDSSERLKLLGEYTKESELPVMKKESFREVCNLGKRLKKPILLYLHSFTENEALVSNFVLNILSTKEVIKVINENYIFWVGDSDLVQEKFRISRKKLGITTFPVLAIISNSAVVAILDLIEGEFGIDEFMKRLLEQMDLFTILNTTEQNKNQLKKTESILEREQQDEEFERLLEIDREKQKQMLLQEQKLEEEKLFKEKQLNDKIKKLEELKQALPEEPSGKNVKNCTRIKFRMKNGDVIRKFLDTNTLKVLFDFILVHNNDIFEFDLIQSYPKRTEFNSNDVKIFNLTLKEVGLCPQALLDVRIVEDDEDEDDQEEDKENQK
ncbi:fas-associated factor 2 [Anaeramoeba flamelloides]|uniref:Fas-associated factor 2 n=1 Tax=Anaeramoeba flamelloides TaxID=1746091 RepID=A0ABQ8YYB5_9EUKA|nr:fas-associated factor 2 [Anaeramoeba flamelloides]